MENLCSEMSRSRCEVFRKSVRPVVPELLTLVVGDGPCLRRGKGQGYGRVVGEVVEP